MWLCVVWCVVESDTLQTTWWDHCSSQGINLSSIFFLFLPLDVLPWASRPKICVEWTPAPRISKPAWIMQILFTIVTWLYPLCVKHYIHTYTHAFPGMYAWTHSFMHSFMIYVPLQHVYCEILCNCTQFHHQLVAQSLRLLHSAFIFSHTCWPSSRNYKFD